MIVVWVLWVACGPALLIAAAVRIQCAVFLHAERARAGTLSGAVTIAACRRSARHASLVLLISLAVPIVIWLAWDRTPYVFVAFWVPWYYILMGALYPPLMVLPVGLVIAVAFLTRYLMRAPERWREAGRRAAVVAT